MIFFARGGTDGVVVRLVGKWLHAGVLEGGVVHRSDRGTPQGGVVSPLLANIFLHEALDTWWVKDVLPRLRGRGGLVRYADDFVMVFSRREDAERVRAALPKRMARYGLTVHPEKTRLVRFERPRGDGKGGKPESFDFLGFTYFWTRTRRGRYQFRRKTAKSRFSRALRSLNEWLRKVRHWKVSAQARGLGRKLLGHFSYYGVAGNSDSINRFHYEARRLWRKWLSRRSQRAWLTWEKFNRLLSRYRLPRARLRPRELQLRLANL